MARATILLAAALLVPAAARAQWQRWSTGAPSLSYRSVSSYDGTHVFVAGSDITMGSMMPVIRSKVQASADGGRTFTDISGTLGTRTGLDTVGAVFFVTAYTGWVTVGKRVHATTNAGGAWASYDAGVVGLALHFFDAERGVLVGEDGGIRRTADGGRTWGAIASPTTLPLRSLHFLDDQRGWAAGWSENDETDLVEQGVLLRTTDGGVTWTQAAQMAGVALGPVFFLCDGRTGWIGGYRTPDDDVYKMTLFKTGDGGSAWQEVALPVVVGKQQTLGITGDLEASKIHAMYWEDDQRGHLAGVAWLAKTTESSEGGGSSTTVTRSVWDEVWFETADGGATWKKRDLGTVVSAGMPPQPPPHENWIGGGLLRDLYTGWMVGDTASVWGHQKTCRVDEQCGEGYVCGAQGSCMRALPRTCDGECPAGQVKLDGRCQKPPDGTTDGGPGGPDGEGEDDGLRFIGLECGCAGASPAAAGALALLLLALRRRRGAAPHLS